MRKTTVLLALVAIAVAWASSELPDLPVVHPRATWEAPSPPVIEPVPVWHRLRAMTPAERANAIISVESADRLARDIEELWNSSRFEEALELFPDLGDVELGITWRVPPMTARTDWEEDVQVGPRDTVQEVHLDVDENTDNLFCAYRYLGDGNACMWAVSISSTGGEIWTETYSWWASYVFSAIGSVCLEDYCYIGYVGGGANTGARLRRVYCSNGQEATFPGGASNLTLHTDTDSLVDICLWSNADTTFDNRIYYSYITSGHQLGVMWMDPVDFDTHHFRGEPADAKIGLDMQWNLGYSDYYLIVSYIDTADYVRVLGVRSPGDTLEYLYTGPHTAINTYTSVAAYHDTFLVCFDHMSSNIQARYLTSYNNGGDWYWLYFGDTTANFTTQADVSGRFGYGTGVVFWQYPQDPCGESYTWRDYTGAWDTPVRIQARNTLSSAVHPQVEWVEPDIAGAVYFASRNRIYFTRSDWPTGVADRNGPALRRFDLRATPAANGVRVRFSLARPGPAAIGLYDATGRLVLTRHYDLTAGEHDVTLPSGPAGAYFVRLTAAGETATTKTFTLR